jgi:uncharacterized membrane protein
MNLAFGALLAVLFVITAVWTIVWTNRRVTDVPWPIRVFLSSVAVVVLTLPLLLVAQLLSSLI